MQVMQMHLAALGVVGATGLRRRRRLPLRKIA